MKKHTKEFSKLLLIQESVLIWISTIAAFGLAYVCIINQYFGELPWLAVLVGLPWTAYGVSQACYYSKSRCENTKDGIVYETAMLEMLLKKNEALLEDDVEVEEDAVG